MPRKETSLTVSAANGTTTIVGFEDFTTYPQLRLIAPVLPVDFLHIIGDGAVTIYVNQNTSRRFDLFSAGSLEIGDAKARSLSIYNNSGAARTLNVRLVKR